MTVAIAAGALCVQTRNGSYVSPTNWKSFSQWVYLFRDVRLIMLQSDRKSPPESWVKLPGDLEVCALDVLDKNRFFRHLSTFRTAREHIQRVDLLYARMPCYEVYWAFCEAVKQKIPVLLELHGDWETAALFPDGGLLKRATRRLRAKLLKRAVFKMANVAFAVVTIGPVLAEKYVHDKKPVLISTNHTLDERQYHQRQDHNIKGVPRFLFVGDLQARKGLRYLFLSLAQLKKMGREFRMDLIGTGPSKAYLKSYAHQNGFDKWVNFAGYVPLEPGLLEYYRQADIFVLPSVAGEGVPRVTHEAMSQGCPVIATDIGSTKWQLAGGAGIVVPPANVEALTENIVRVLDDEGLRRSLSVKGFSRSMEFTFEKQAEKIAAFVKKNIAAELLV
jgi:glycosyltransferase involved in cell wall biosynthesis